jgi:hypothetical protein
MFEKIKISWSNLILIFTFIFQEQQLLDIRNISNTTANFKPLLNFLTWIIVTILTMMELYRRKMSRLFSITSHSTEKIMKIRIYNRPILKGITHIISPYPAGVVLQRTTILALQAVTLDHLLAWWALMEANHLLPNSAIINSKIHSLTAQAPQAKSPRRLN